MRRRDFLKNGIASTGLLFIPIINVNSFSQKHFSGDGQEFMVGVNNWINPDTPPEQMEKDMKMMAENNFTVIRLWIQWGAANPRQGVWDYSLYENLFEAAERHNIAIISGFAGTQAGRPWLRKEHPKIEWGQIDDLRIREYASEFIKKTVQRFKDHPAHYGWILQNEPHAGREISYHSLTMNRFREWLRNFYNNDINELNRKWHMLSRRNKSFDEINITESTFTAGRWRNHAIYRDWRDFTIWRMTDWLSWIGEEIKKYDKFHPTNINPNDSLDRWDFFKSVDYMGSSLHPTWHIMGRWPMSESPVMVNYIMDEVRSSGKKAETFWITELQGGPSIFSGSKVFTPQSYHIKRWLWNAKAAGASTILFWQWRPRSYNWEVGEWGMLDMSDKPSARVIAAKNVLESMKKHSNILKNSKRAKAPVAIWFSKNNEILGEREYIRNNNRNGLRKALKMCYKALWEANIQVDLISTAELHEGIAGNYNVIFAPEINHVSLKSAEALASFVRQGGHLWADGIFGWKDDYGNLHKTIPGGGLSDIFGSKIRDINGMENPSDMIFTDSGVAVPSFEAEVWLERTTGKIAASFDSGNPAVITNQYGKGSTMLIGTFLCRGLEADYNKSVASFISDFAYKNIKDSLKVNLDIYYGRLRYRIMEGIEGPIVVISNYGEENGKGLLKVKNRFNSAKELMNNVEYKTDVSNGWSALTVDVLSKETLVYAFI